MVEPAHVDERHDVRVELAMVGAEIAALGPNVVGVDDSRRAEGSRHVPGTGPAPCPERLSLQRGIAAIPAQRSSFEAGTRIAALLDGPEERRFV